MLNELRIDHHQRGKRPTLFHRFEEKTMPISSVWASINSTAAISSTDSEYD
jgi:hypothetical protein